MKSENQNYIIDVQIYINFANTLFLFHKQKVYKHTQPFGKS